LRKQMLFTGCATALATPFTPEGIDVQALAALADWQIKEGVSALIACGTTGEPSTMSQPEWELTVKTVVKSAAGRVPVIAGTGGNNTANVMAKARIAKCLGANAQLCVTPYYNKTTQAGLVAHYTAIADAGDLPIILYNVPSRTGLNMSADTVIKLSCHEQIIALKEANCDLFQLGDAILGCEGRIAFYSGADEVIVPLMSLGGHGVISVISNVIPRFVSELCAAMLAHDYAKGARMQLDCLPLIHALFSEVNPIAVKHALYLLHKCQDIVRLPLINLSEANRVRLIEQMRRMGILA
jgi:4-hydroxy-tetrahydrodipicolinate synthase